MDQRGAPFRLLLCGLIGLALLRPPCASADEVARFDSAAAGAKIQGYLTMPRGAGPFPAVVLLHSCLGLPADRNAIGAMFAGWGYAALFVDEFATRGIKDTCARDFGEGLADAFGALRYLAARDDVDPKRIAAVGWSQGADIALQGAALRRAAAAPAEPNFKAAAAFYPPCDNQAGAMLGMPTLILIGGADDVTPAADCEKLARKQAGLVSLVVYPDARHLFDDPGYAGGKRVGGMWLQYDAQAAGRSREALRGFLAAKLGR
jgi:dienelactone hydrolase